jgi:small nuclear ribonucleoprotein F
VLVRLKWNETEYKGKLVSVDTYMNLQLDDAVEYIQGKQQGEIGEVLIRCVQQLLVLNVHGYEFYYLLLSRARNLTSGAIMYYG